MVLRQAARLARPGRVCLAPGHPTESGCMSPQKQEDSTTSGVSLFLMVMPTSGLTEEEGIAMASDGRSFVTAVALQNVSVWVHDGNGDRQISRLEGNAAYPKFTPDGKRLCYRIVNEVPRFGTNRDPGELWVADLESGHSEAVAPGFQPIDYDISPDGQQVVMEAPDGEGKPRFWLAPLEHRSPRLEIPNVEGRHAIYGPGGEIFFLRMEGHSGFVYSVKSDGTGMRKVFEQTVLSLGPFTPDGRWVVAWAPLPGTQGSAVQLLSLGGRKPIIIGSNTALHWSHNGDSVWVSGGVVPDGQTYVVPSHPSELLPPLPTDGFHSEEEIVRLPGSHKIDSGGAPGPSRDIYAFLRSTVQRNLYRVPIP